MNELIEKRLLQIRCDFMRAEMLARAICRIASEPDCPLEDLQSKLLEIETIGEILIDLISDSAGQMEPGPLLRHVASMEENDGGEHD